MQPSSNRLLKFAVFAVIMLLIGLGVMAYLWWGNPTSSVEEAPPLVFERETEKSLIREANNKDYPDKRLGESEIEAALSFEVKEMIKEYDSVSKSSTLKQEHYSYTTELSNDALLAKSVRALEDLNYNVEYNDSIPEMILIEGSKGATTITIAITNKGNDRLVGISVANANKE